MTTEEATPVMAAQGTLAAATIACGAVLVSTLITRWQIAAAHAVAPTPAAPIPSIRIDPASYASGYMDGLRRYTPTATDAPIDPVSYACGYLDGLRRRPPVTPDEVQAIRGVPPGRRHRLRPVG